MPSATERGPSVPDHEELFRAITVPDWWLADPERPRPRSAAFSYPSFSTNIASMILLDGAIRHLAEVLRCPNGAIVGFSCRMAKELGFDPRQELDPAHPDNLAHANVYSDGGSSERKRRAKRLAEEYCRVAKPPTFGSEANERH